MPFDPNRFAKVQKTLESSPSRGFDPARYERTKAQVAAPQLAPARPSPVGRAMDFTRRAFMGDSIEPAHRNVLQNAVNDADEIITGTSHLIGQGLVEGGKLAKDVITSAGPSLTGVLGPPTLNDIAQLPNTPIGKRVSEFPSQVGIATSKEGKKIAKEEFIRPAYEAFKKSFTTPMKSFKEHPLFTFMDWTTAVDAVGGVARGGLEVAAKGASMAGKVELADKLASTLSTVRPSLEVAPRGEILRDFSKNPIVKMGIQKPFDKFAANPAMQEFFSSQPLLKWLAPNELLTAEERAGRVAENVAKQSQSEFYRVRNERMNEAMAQFAKLPKNERESFVAVVQGRAMPRSLSPQFKEVYDWYKNSVADEQAKFGLTDETVKRVAFQPLAVSQGILTPDDYKLALRGDSSAVEKVRKGTDAIADARVRVQEDAIKDWMGKNTEIDRRTKGFKGMARELTEALAPDPLYFPSVFADKIKISDFMPTKFLQRFRPGFQKGRTGAFGFIEKEPEVAFAIHQSQVERYLQNEAVINRIKDKFALPLKNASEIKPGWEVFAPDGYIKFYKGVMPLQEAFLRGVGMGQSVDDAFLAAIKKVMPTMVEDKTFVGVGRPQLYQIPKPVATSLHEAIKPQPKVPELFKLFYDKPLQAFKFSVLAMSPRWVVNNTLGNIVTTMSGRVSPESFIKAGKQIYKDLIPPEVESGGFRRSEFPSINRVVAPSTGLADKVTGFFSGKTPTEGVLKDFQNVVSRPVKAIAKVADTVFEANSKIEDAFRSATFIDKATKAAVAKIATDTSTGIFDMKKSLDRFLERGSFNDSNVAKVVKEMLKDDSFKAKMVDQVNYILNDYNSLTKFERGVVRRVVPFWSWWKFVNVMFWSMPIKDPAMAQTIKQLGIVGNAVARDEWKANGLNVDEIPGWMRGNIILGKTDDKKLLQLLNTRSLNPLSSAREAPGLSPQLQMFEERRSGRQYLTGAPFTHPNEVETRSGAIYRDDGQGTKRQDRPTPPPFLTHLLRQFPQVNILEALAFPYKTYTGESIGSDAVRSIRGRGQKSNPNVKIANILGMPITETDIRRLRSAHKDAMEAGRNIKHNMKRSNRTLERVKLGVE